MFTHVNSQAIRAAEDGLVPEGVSYLNYETESMATVSSTKLEALLGAGYHYHDQLQNELKNLVQLRRNTIRQLREIANSLDEHHKRANVSKLLGSGVGGQ